MENHRLKYNHDHNKCWMAELGQGIQSEVGQESIFHGHMKFWPQQKSPLGDDIFCHLHDIEQDIEREKWQALNQQQTKEVCGESKYNFGLEGINYGSIVSKINYATQFRCIGVCGKKLSAQVLGHKSPTMWRGMHKQEPPPKLE